MPEDCRLRTGSPQVLSRAPVGSRTAVKFIMARVDECVTAAGPVVVSGSQRKRLRKVDAELASQIEAGVCLCRHPGKGTDLHTCNQQPQE